MTEAEWLKSAEENPGCRCAMVRCASGHCPFYKRCMTSVPGRWSGEKSAIIYHELTLGKLEELYG